MFRLTLLLALGVGLESVHGAEGNRPFTLDTFARYKTIDSLKISPEGKRFLFTMLEFSGNREKLIRSLWVIPSLDREPRELAKDIAMDLAPEWSPDGKSIAYLGHRVGRLQLCILNVRSTKVRTLAEVEARSLQWSPDGRYMAVVGSTRGGSRKPDADLAVASEQPPASVPSLLLFSVAGGAPTKLADDAAVSGISWSPSSDEIAFVAHGDLFISSVRLRSVRRLVERPGDDATPLWSPDGRSIAFTSEHGRPRDQRALSIVDVSTGKIEDSFRSLDFGFGGYPPRFIGWSSDSKTLYLSVLSHMHQDLYSLSVSSGEYRSVTPGTKVYHDYSLSTDTKTFACLASDPATPSEIVVSPLAGFQPRSKSFAHPELSGIELGKTEVVHWKNEEGIALEGLLMKPAGYVAGRPYPMVVLTEGSHGTFDLSFTTRTSADTAGAIFPFQPQVFAGRGYLVFMPNVRGSWGYGEDFRTLLRHNIGWGPLEDLMTGVDHLADAGIADRDRLAILGMGFDGYRAAFAITQTTRFKAAVIGEPFGADLFSFYGQSDYADWLEYQMEGPPWEKTSRYVELSPVLLAAHIKTPTLLFCLKGSSLAGPQCAELHRALQKLHVATELITYDQDQEEFGSAKMRALLELMKRNADWVDKWLPPQP